MKSCLYFVFKLALLIYLLYMHIWILFILDMFQALRLDLIEHNKQFRFSVYTYIYKKNKPLRKKKNLTNGNLCTQISYLDLR